MSPWPFGSRREVANWDFSVTTADLLAHRDGRCHRVLDWGHQHAVAGAVDCSGGFVDPGACAIGGGLVLGEVGAVIGGITGALLKTDRWDEVGRNQVQQIGR